MYSAFSMNSICTIALWLSLTLALVACAAETAPRKQSAASRDQDAQVEREDDYLDSGVATRGAGMPIVPIRRMDAGAKGDATIPVGNAAPARADATVDAGVVDAGVVDAGSVAVPPTAELDAAATVEEAAADAQPPQAALTVPEPTRRFSFGGSGSSAPDLIGGGDATVHGNAVLDGSGTVSFPGLGDGYVELPSELLDDAASFTVLLWLSLSSDACGQRALELTHSQPGSGSTSLSLSPYSCPDELPTLGYSAGNAQYVLRGETRLKGAGLVQLGLSFSARSQTLRLIVDGVVHNEQSVPVDVRTLQKARGTLGRADAGHPQLSGTITELRVYDSRLDPQTLAEVYARGPDEL